MQKLLDILWSPYDWDDNVGYLFTYTKQQLCQSVVKFRAKIILGYLAAVSFSSPLNAACKIDVKLLHLRKALFLKRSAQRWIGTFNRFRMSLEPALHTLDHALVYDTAHCKLYIIDMRAAGLPRAAGGKQFFRHLHEQEAENGADNKS